MNPDRDPNSEIEDLQGGLKALVTRLSEPQLLLVRTWVEQEIRFAKKPALRVVHNPGPGQVEGEHWVGSFGELAGAVRRRIHELPVDRLIVLNIWVHAQLGEQYGYRR
jgi:hypothetical protein